jgi:hypothetical protein
MDANLALVERVRAVAERHGATPAQVALAWVLAQGDHVVPIPGTKRLERLEENVAAAELALTAEDLAELGRLEVAEALDHLGGGQVVVAGDRERGAVLGQQLLGLPARATQQVAQQVGGVVAGHPAAPHGVVERLLQAVAGDHHDVERVEQPPQRRADALGVVFAGH